MVLLEAEAADTWLQWKGPEVLFRLSVVGEEGY